MLRSDKTILSMGGMMAAGSVALFVQLDLMKSMNIPVENFWDQLPLEKFTDGDKAMYYGLGLAAVIAFAGLLLYTIYNLKNQGQDKGSDENSIFTKEGLIEAKDTLKGVLEKITSCGPAGGAYQEVSKN